VLKMNDNINIAINSVSFEFFVIALDTLIPKSVLNY